MAEPRAKLPPLTETDFQRVLVKTLSALGWAHMHVRRSIGKGKRWTTATSAVGWPDLLAVRGDWMIVVEVKSDTGEFREGQLEWLERFARLPFARVWVLRPADPWAPVTEWMQTPSEAPATFGWEPAIPPDERLAR